jgi:MFS family permease
MLRQVPEDMRGRVTSTVTVTAMSLATVAPLVAGLLVEHVSVSWAAAAFAAAEAAAAVLALTMQGLRDADRAANLVNQLPPARSDEGGGRVQREATVDPQVGDGDGYPPA